MRRPDVSEPSLHAQPGGHRSHAPAAVDPHDALRWGERHHDRWLERWIRSTEDLARLQYSHRMLDAVIDEIDGRQIRVGDQWLTDYASCNYLGLDLDEEIIAAVPEYLRRWGTHPSWSRLLGSPVLYEQIEDQLTALLGCEDSLLLPTITHIHMSVIPVLAGGGTVFLDSRAHKTIYDGCALAAGARRHHRTLRARGPGPARGAAARRELAAPGDDLHRRRQQHDRQRAGPGRVRALAREHDVAAVRRRRPRLRRDRRALAGRAVRLRRPRQQHRPPRRRELREHRPGRRLLQGLLVAAGVHRLPDRAQAGAEDRGAAVPLLGPVAGRLAGHRDRGPARQRGARRSAPREAPPPDRPRPGPGPRARHLHPEPVRASRSSRFRSPTPTASTRSATSCSTAAST